MNVDGLYQAAERVANALAPAGLVVHLPPMPTSPVSAPCLLLDVPAVGEFIALPGSECGYKLEEVSVDVLVVGSSPLGHDLLTTTDTAIAALAAADLTVTSTAADEYSTGSTTPGPLPAIRLTVE